MPRCLWRIPQALLPGQQSSLSGDLTSLLVLAGFYIAFMIPLDLLGGYLLPRHYGRLQLTFASYASQWARGVLVQAVLYVFTAATLLFAGRMFGVFGAVAALVAVSLLFLAAQRSLVLLTTRGTCDDCQAEIKFAQQVLTDWNINSLPMTVVNHQDPGFTGGVVGLPFFESLVVSRDWVKCLSANEFSAAIARRCEAVRSGSRTRGLILALVWIVVGFLLATQLPSAGVTTVAQLVTTLLGFTLWTFLGLLLLPSISRQASYAIDRRIIAHGVSEHTLTGALSKLDMLQDDEPQRSMLIESIFHPVPSLSNRRALSTRTYPPIAWHAARMTLFLSWGCAGLLSCAVHCNVGRPELWVMLPTD